jgi:hypothetical protein
MAFMKLKNIEIPIDKISALCKQWHSERRRSMYDRRRNRRYLHNIYTAKMANRATMEIFKVELRFLSGFGQPGPTFLKTFLAKWVS